MPVCCVLQFHRGVFFFVCVIIPAKNAWFCIDFYNHTILEEVYTLVRMSHVSLLYIVSLLWIELEVQ